MGTASTTNIVKPNEARASESLHGIGSPITNEAYDVLSALKEKLEGLEAYRKYAHDANPEVWRRLTAADMGSVELLCDELERLVRDGKFRLREPGGAGTS